MFNRVSKKQASKTEEYISGFCLIEYRNVNNLDKTALFTRLPDDIEKSVFFPEDAKVEQSVSSLKVFIEVPRSALKPEGKHFRLLSGIDAKQIKKIIFADSKEIPNPNFISQEALQVENDVGMLTGIAMKSRGK